MRFLVLSLIILAAALLGAYRFAGLRIFNLLVPKDSESALAASRLSFGPDPSQTLDIYAPTSGRGPWPVIVFVHGGSWRDGNARDYAFVGRAFAAQGFVTFVANYRKRPLNAFPAFVEDAALALAYAQKNALRWNGMHDRVFAVGHSAGAYNLALAILDRRFLEGAGFDGRGLKGFASLAGPFDFLPLDGPTTIDTFGQVPDLPSTQPVNFARNDAPPMLLLTGTADTTVYLRNSIRLSQRLQETGGSAEVRQYPGITHVSILLALAKPLRSWAPVLDDVTAFFNANSP
jgi:acetyl esterase/lipase